MAKVSDIIRQLQQVLPKQTSLFSDTLTISTLTGNGTKGKWETSDISANLASLIVVNDGSLTVTVDGTIHSLTAIDLTSATTLINIATILDALFTDCDVSATTTKIIFTSKSYGATSIIIISGGGIGTDLAGAGYFNSPTGIETDGISTSLVTVKTSVDHGLSTNNMVLVKGTKTKNPIDSWSINADGYLEIVCHTEHDKTLDYLNTLYAELNYSNLTGSYLILDVPDHYTLVLDTAVNPIGTGELLETRMDGYNGFKTITVPAGSADTFTYTHTGLSLIADISSGQVIGNYRIAGVSDISRVFGYYEKQDSDTKLWAWIILGKCTASFTRDSQTDAKARFTKLDSFLQELYQQFHVVVAVPTSNYVSGIEAVDMMQDIRSYLLKSLCGVMFDSGFTMNEKYMCNFVEDSEHGYAGSYYLHNFVFETVSVISEDDIVDEDDTRAFREVEIDNAFEFDNYVDIARKNVKTDL